MTLFIPRAAAVGATLLVLLLSACGQPATEPTTTTPASEPVEASEAPAANLTDGCIENHTPGTDYFPEKATFDEASGVSVEYAGDHKIVEVETLAGEEPLRYVLLQCGAPEPELEGDLADAVTVEVPVESVISLTTTNLPHFAMLGGADRVVGVGTGAFVTTKEILDRIEAGDVKDFAGPEGQVDVEAVLGAAPDLVIMDAFGDAILEEAERFVAAGVPTVLNADFNEQTMLGRAEWLKFTSLFLNAEGQANDLFAQTAANYEEVKQAAAASENAAPTVFANTPYEGTWFMPAGNSFFANAIADANGKYVFDDDNETYSLQLDIETVLNRAADADVWLQAGSVNGTLDDLLAIDERFDEFKAFRRGNVWAYDKVITEAGGNAFFEEAYTRADVVLSDLVKILHPEALPDHELVYFGQVPEGKGR